MGSSRICIVTPRSINDSPCLEKYRAYLDEPYDIIYWTKGDDRKDCGATNTYPYKGEVPVEGGKWRKIKHYCAFMKYAKAVIRKYKFEKLIVYPTHMAWLLRGMLRREYKGKYILDVRDYAGENNPVIGRLTSEAVNNSGLCTITSPAYLNYLPKNHNYIISHNIQTINNDIIRSYRTRKLNKTKPIALAFIGTVRFLEQQKKIISVFGNDDRFIIRYIGRGSDALNDFCKEGKYKNVELVGQFDRSELGKYYMETDMAINIYGNNDPALVYALSNKLYSAALMGMPVLASPNTYTSEIIEKYHFGYTIDLDDCNCANYLYQYYMNLDRECLTNGCDAFMEKVYSDERLYRAAIHSFICDTKDGRLLENN